METDYYDSLATELSVVQKVSLAVSTSQEYWFVAESTRIGTGISGE